MGLREKKRAATREAIVAAAGQLFSVKDYDAVTVDEIAAAAEVAKGTVYNYFPSKEHLAAALANAVFQEGLPLVEDLLAEGATAIDVLKGLFTAGAAWAEGNPRLAHVTLSHVLRQVFADPAVLPGHVEGYNSLYSLVLRMVETAQTAGQLRSDVAAPELAQTLALLHTHTLWLWTVTPTEAASARMARCLQSYLEGIAAEE